MLRNLLRSRPVAPTERRGGFSDYLRELERFSFNGISYAAGQLDHRATEFVASNAAVSAVLNFRVSVFAEATFKFQNWQNGRPGALFGTPSLALLEQPWPGAGTSHLLAAVECDTSVYGNSYWIEDNRRLVRLDPRYTTLVMEEVYDSTGTNCVGEVVIGYAYQPDRQKPATYFLATEVAHVRLLPDPTMPCRGTSWLRAVLPDADADAKMTRYKTALLDNAAVPGLIIKAEPGISQEQVAEAREAIKARNTGVDKVGRTLILGAGFDPTVVGQNMQQLDMKAIQGAGESRIAAAAGVSPVLAGFSEGLQGSSLNAGNYGAARRRFADGTMRPLWRATCTAFSVLVPPPAGSRLWIDERDVSFLQEDVMDAASIKSTEANTIESLIRAGFDPVSVRDAVTSGDFTVLSHTGLYSVQLQTPGTGDPVAPQRAADEPTEARTAPVVPVQPMQLTFNIDSRADVPAAQVQVDVHPPEQRAEAPVVNITTPAPVVENVINVEPTPVQVDARTSVEPAVVNVPTPNVTVSPQINVEVPPYDDGPSRKTVKFQKDKAGNIVGATVSED